MKQFRHFAFSALIICSLIGRAFGQGVVESDLQKIANKFIPEGMVSAHEAVQGRFAESASKDASGNIVVLYEKGSYGVRYEGLVLLPQGSDAYDQHKLPEPEAVWSMMDPIAVFSANADGDTENELFIIDKCYTGIGPTGARPFYRTRVYDWNCIAFFSRRFAQWKDRKCQYRCDGTSKAPSVVEDPQIPKDADARVGRIWGPQRTDRQGSTRRRSLGKRTGTDHRSNVRRIFRNVVKNDRIYGADRQRSRLIVRYDYERWISG